LIFHLIDTGFNGIVYLRPAPVEGHAQDKHKKNGDIMGKIIFKSSLYITLFVAMTVGAMGSTVAYRDAGIEMDIPEGLVLDVQNGFLTVVDSERTMTLRIILSQLQVVEQFFGPLEEEISNYIDQPEVREEHPEIQINEMLHYYAEGLGLVEDEIVDWHIAFIAGGSRSLLIIGLGDFAPHMEKINEFYRSIRLLELPIPPEPEEEEGEEGEEENPDTQSGNPAANIR